MQNENATFVFEHVHERVAIEIVRYKVNAAGMDMPIRDSRGVENGQRSAQRENEVRH